MWGWGQVAAGDRRGWPLPLVQAGAIAGLVAIAPSLAPGSGLPALFLAAVSVVAAWGAIAVHAYRVAARRRARLDLPTSASGASDLLWLAPLAIAAVSLPWIVGGQAADPGSAIDAYVRAWRASDAAGASRRLAGSPASATIVDAWQRQAKGLRDELLRIAPQAGPDGALDPDRPLDAVRWIDAGGGAGGNTRTIALEVARVDTVHDLVLGVIPVTSQRLVTIARLGTAVVRAVPTAGPWVEWRIVRIEIAGVALGA